ncbi:MAG: site-specific integrase [Spirochaetales bacterium]|nr:site-specific integrase [Spirochaetales bacterium]
MQWSEAIQEFGFDCKVRKLSPKTIDNYTKQLRYFQRYLQSEFEVAEIGQVKMMA